MSRILAGSLLFVATACSGAPEPAGVVDTAGAAGLASGGGAGAGTTLPMLTGADAGASAGAGAGGMASGAGVTSGGSGGSAPDPSERWTLDSVISIAGHTPEVWGAPTLSETPYGTALCFDGDDALLLPKNPLEGLSAFTLEVLFRPDPVDDAALAEPRFVHIETSAADRVTVEARVTTTQFYLDTFLSSAGMSKTLSEATHTHSVNEWHWAALTYADGKLRHYVDALEDASADLNATPLGPGRTSIGARQNRVHWFSGCVRELRFWPRALGPESLSQP